MEEEENKQPQTPVELLVNDQPFKEEITHLGKGALTPTNKKHSHEITDFNLDTKMFQLELKKQLTFVEGSPTQMNIRPRFLSMNYQSKIAPLAGSIKIS
jgi:hypothetical protein